MSNRYYVERTKEFVSNLRILNKIKIMEIK